MGNVPLYIIGIMIIILLMILISSLLLRNKKDRLMKQQMDALKATFNSLVEKTQVGVYIVKGDRFTYVNKTFADIFGYEMDEMLNMQVSEVLTRSEWRDLQKIQALMQNGDTDHLRFKYQGNQKDGQEIYLDVHGSSLPHEDRSLIGTIIDLTQQREIQLKAHKLTFFDSLTLLPNRFSLHQKLDELIRLSKFKHQNFALIMLDLDRFKMINDSMGHAMGDQLLVLTAERLIRNTGYDVYRHNGDEFGLVVPHTDRKAVAAVAMTVMSLFEKPFTLGGVDVYTSVSLGISVYPGDGHTKEQLMKNADTAVYYVKKAGKNHYQFYEHAFNEDLHQKLTIETELRRAIEKNEFVLHYQPQVNLETGEIIGNEALIRWNHPTRGILQPASFIDHAEETDLIIPMGEWVLRTACIQTKLWHDKGHYLFVSVNLSPKQLFQKNFAKKVASILKETNFDAGSLS